MNRCGLSVVYHKDGTDRSKPVLERLLADKRALHDTQRYYGTRLADARFMTPSPTISRGVVWAKANMLRIVKDYPQGWGSTNSPPSDILVSRDTSWFVHGFDYFWPQFSRDALEVFNAFVDETGLMIEYVRGVNGYKTAYDLNINDDTPLHLIAMLHHYNATLDDSWVRERLALIVKITDYMMTQVDDQGLLFCKAKGVDMYGISSWRNIIPYYTLDGAVTEINAEGVYALEAAAMLCAVAGDNEHWEKYSLRGAAAAQSDDGLSVQRRYRRVRPELRSRSQLSRQLHGRRSLSGAVQRGQSRAAARDSQASARSGFRDAGWAAHDLDGRLVVFPVVRIRSARRHLARSDVVVRLCARAQRFH